MKPNALFWQKHGPFWALCLLAASILLLILGHIRLGILALAAAAVLRKATATPAKASPNYIEAGCTKPGEQETL